jgi:hypothetical protein
LRINLEAAQINTTIAKQFLKAVADGIGTQPTDEGHRCTKTCQCASDIRRGTAKSVIAFQWISQGRITAQWSEPIHKSLPKTKHLRSGIRHRTCSC